MVTQVTLRPLTLPRELYGEHYTVEDRLRMIEAKLRHFGNPEPAPLVSVGAHCTIDERVQAMQSSILSMNASLMEAAAAINELQILVTTQGEEVRLLKQRLSGIVNGENR